MKKTTFLPVLGLMLAAAVFLTAFSDKKPLLNDPEVTFEEFLQQFSEKSLPYSLDENSLKAQLDKYVTQVNHPDKETYKEQPKRLDWKYYQFLPDLKNEASFSRLPMQAEAVAMFAAGDKIGVMYSTSRSFRFGYATFHVCVFDKKGNQISNNVVGKVMPESIMSASISKMLQATLKSWHIDWKKDYAKNGLDGNQIKGLSLVESSNLDLTLPTPKSEGRFDKRMIAPPVIEEMPQSVESIKSK